MRQEKGITLVALVITIIVMLILVAVSVTIALQPGGLFDNAKDAAGRTNNAYINEQQLSSGSVTYNNAPTTINALVAQ